MTVYVDAIRRYRNLPAAARPWGSKWCHMWADSPEELERLAELMGLDPSWRQGGSLDHYDLTPEKRELALRLGAKKGSLHHWFRRRNGRA